jgi:hypothetical protein
MASSAKHASFGRHLLSISTILVLSSHTSGESHTLPCCAYLNIKLPVLKSPGIGAGVGTFRCPASYHGICMATDTNHLRKDLGFETAKKNYGTPVIVLVRPQLDRQEETIFLSLFSSVPQFVFHAPVEITVPQY